MKKRMQKQIAILLCLTMAAASLAGCNNVDKKPAESQSSMSGEGESQGDVGGVVDEEKKDMVFGSAGTISAYDTKRAHYGLSIDASKEVHDISELLYGIFIEDINFAADGGLYAELIQNRSFEFTKLASGDEKHAWSDVGTILNTVKQNDTVGGLNENNTNYLVMENGSGEMAGIANQGFLDGIAVSTDAKYNFSVYLKGLEGYTGPVLVDIMHGNKSIAAGKIDAVTNRWEKYELELTASATANSNVKLQLTMGDGKLAVDMVSLFPQDTYKGRENGLRRDLVEKLEALEPAFLRFPGGCVVEGNNKSNAYDWKDSIGVGADGAPLLFNGGYGDVAARPQGINIWSDLNATEDQYPAYMSYGLGFYEYFLLAEDLGALAVPVVNCGLFCQVRGGQPVPIGSEEFQQYIQDALDLVEFCRGDETTAWGRVRISLGHTKPFELKYIGIGNENWGTDYYSRYEKFRDAFEAAAAENPKLFEGVEIMFSAGTDDGDSGVDYIKAYQRAEQWLKKNPDKAISDYAGAIDHHYYNDPAWFLANTDYYDEENYSRDTANMTEAPFGGAINVFVGEYAAKSNRLEAALAEAAYMTGLERNGDIIKMAAYAPLFGNITRVHWAPDLIWFNNHTVTCSTSYYMQQIFAKNAGSVLLESKLTGALIDSGSFGGKVGVGTWSTSASFDNVKIVNNDTGEVLSEADFEKADAFSDWTKVSDGNWKIEDGVLVQASNNTNTNKYANTGTAAYYGDTNWHNYTYTLEATKLGGVEGFLIPFAVQDKDNNFFWNIGGWGNSVSCLQQVKDGSKSDQIAGTVKNIALQTGKTYRLKIVVTDSNVKCYIDDKLYVDYTLEQGSGAECYHVVSSDENGDIIIKIVNVTGKDKTLAIDLKGVVSIGDSASVDVVAGTALSNDNILGQPEGVHLKSTELSGITEQFNYTVPKYSVTVLRIKTM